MGSTMDQLFQFLCKWDAYAPYSHVCHLKISIQVNAINDMDLVKKNKMNERKWI